MLQGINPDMTAADGIYYPKFTSEGEEEEEEEGRCLAHSSIAGAVSDQRRDKFP